ncbi:hypothetical protein VSR01_17070 [Actinacidiphila sp. DG2A-62]|uniref:hypothetical protein n=1 Tax=Actinacidiphila sp. DG2A-62 TaxID=3108821 RepID=UPI002DB76F78|nr:hypothetical protein [Actinacidiphila sp. DG2A-62]MEC3995150.1 hypothetical protein [Actinacidiphila sp. DG2A-62]
MAMNPTAIFDLAEVVLACLCAELEATAAVVEGQPGCPERSCVVPGTAAWDDCDGACEGLGKCGQLTVNVARIYPSTNFPAVDQTVLGLRGCTPPPTTAAEFVITLLRCTPTLNDEGCPPSCEEIAASAKVVYTDMATVANALTCCLPGTAPRGRRFVLGQSKILGPDGGCVGVEQRVTVAIPGCYACPSEESP